MVRKASDKPKKPRKNAKKPETEQQTKPEAQAQPSGGSETVVKFKRPTADQVKRLVKALISRANEARKITQEASEKLAGAVESQHFDKKALGIAKSLYQMSVNRPEAFAITFHHLLAYIDDLELAKTADENVGMNFDAKDEGGDDEQAPPAAPAGGLRVVPKDEDAVSPAEATDAA